MKIYSSRQDNYFDKYAGKDAWIKVFKPCDPSSFYGRSKVGYLRILKHVGSIGTIQCYQVNFVETGNEDFYECTERQKQLAFGRVQTILDQNFEILTPVDILTTDELFVIKDDANEYLQ